MVLVLKHKWFDMIASGEKKEEYREWKPYWRKRLWRLSCFDNMIIDFRRGYTKTSIKVECVGYVYKYQRENGEWYYSMAGNASTPEYKASLSLDVGRDLIVVERREEWGYEPDKNVIVFRLGEIMK